MEEATSYFGFPEMPEIDALVDALFTDPTEVRWRVIRTLLRIENSEKINEVRQKLHSRIAGFRGEMDWKVQYRLQMAMKTIQRPVRVNGYAVVKGKGAFTTKELAAADHDLAKLGAVRTKPDYYPVVDFHVHPKMPDLKFLSDLKKAEISHAVLLATDNDPKDVDRPEIQERLRRNYERSHFAATMPFKKFLSMVRGDLYSVTHVTDQDVADWVSDYPEVLFGFGSVNLGKNREYVEKKLDCIEKLGLKGIKLLPYSQFFNPAENDNMEFLFQYCRRTGSIILSHTGCAAEPFEDPELSQDSRPELWEPMVKKYPDVPVVLAHFASYSSGQPGIWFSQAMDLGKKYPNVYADISAAQYLLDDKEKIERIRKSIGFDQVLFATDYPGPIYYGIEISDGVNKIKENPFLSKEEIAAVLGGNAQKLLGIA
jgi:predicted TIM-barrel fold metal-dependent hydrolase